LEIKFCTEDIQLSRKVLRHDSSGNNIHILKFTLFVSVFIPLFYVTYHLLHHHWKQQCHSFMILLQNPVHMHLVFFRAWKLVTMKAIPCAKQEVSQHQVSNVGW